MSSLVSIFLLSMANSILKTNALIYNQSYEKQKTKQEKIFSLKNKKILTPRIRRSSNLFEIKKPYDFYRRALGVTS